MIHGTIRNIRFFFGDSLRSTISKFPLIMYFTSVIGLVELLASCSMTQVVPIQASRIHQTEVYVQRFSFLDNLNAEKIVQEDQRTFAQTQKMDQIFTHLFGGMNWQNLKDLYGIGNIRNELITNKIYVRGIANFTIYLDPFDIDYFSIEGSGRFFVIRKKTDAILMTGDYIIGEKVHSVSDLKKGYLNLDVELFVSRIPNNVTYFHEVPLVYQIYIDNRLGEKGVFSIDYRKKHNVYFSENNQIQTLLKGNNFANITIKAPKGATKLFDFRGIEFIRRDYQQLIKNSRQ